jgi:hypothetical protein
MLEVLEAVGVSVRAQRPLSPAESQFLRLSEQVAADVLESGEVSELRARLYRAATNPTLVRAEALAVAELDFRRIPAPEEHVVALQRVLGDTSLARECARLLVARTEALRVLFERFTPQKLPSDEEMHSLLDSPFLPPLIRAQLLETLAAEVALLVLMATRVDEARWSCPPWARLALLDQLRLGSIAHLRLLATAPGVTVPSSLLPHDERLDLSSLFADHRALMRYALPSELRVSEEFADVLLDAIDGATPPPEGVRAIFKD